MDRSLLTACHPSSSSTAIGLEFSTINGATFVFTLSNGDSFTDTATPGFGNVAFLGFADAVPFTTLTISVPTADDAAILVGLSVGAAAVPEPGTPIPANVAVLAGLGWWGRARRR